MQYFWGIPHHNYRYNKLELEKAFIAVDFSNEGFSYYNLL